jgi:hypothetical protein
LLIPELRDETLRRVCLEVGSGIPRREGPAPILEALEALWGREDDLGWMVTIHVMIYTAGRSIEGGTEPTLGFLGKTLREVLEVT